MKRRASILAALAIGVGFGDQVAAQSREPHEEENIGQDSLAKRDRLPLPPAKIGCHVFSEGSWRETPCAPEEETRRLPPPAPALSIQNRPNFLFIPPHRVVSRTTPMKFGEVDINLLSSPGSGTVTDVVTPGSCPTIKSAASYPDSFSVQLNTNTFNTSYGNVGWVQFVLQTGKGQIGVPNKDYLCVWKIDISVANATSNANGYENICTTMVHDKDFLGKAGTGDRLVVAGISRTSPDTGAPVLTTWAQVPWGFYAAAVTTADTITGTFRGLNNDSKQYAFGFGGNWTQVSGDIYGTGCGSQAVFTGVRIQEEVYASTCETFPYSCSAPDTPLSLSHFAARAPDPNVTAESNNLLLNFDPTAGFSSSFNCIYSTTCVTGAIYRSPLRLNLSDHVVVDRP